LRVAFVLPDMSGGGAERVVLTLVEAFVADGHDVDLLLGRAEGALLPLVPAMVRVVDLKASRLRAMLRPLVGYLRRERPNAVHATMWPVTTIALLAHRIAGSRARVVVSDHSTLSLQYADNRKALASLLLSVRLLYPRADARICVSEGSADDLARLTGIDRSSITVIYNPVSPPRPMPHALEDVWPADGPRILTVGSLKREKRHDLLLHAFAGLLRAMPAQLVILGEGDLRLQLARLASELGIGKRVAMPGFAIDPWSYYAAADLFVLSSDFEGYPLVLLEALYSGLRIVSTDCPYGPAEILERGRYGTLVRVDDPPALEAAMVVALGKEHDPQVLVRRAKQLTADALDRYTHAILG
jgi:glycosyltransferase involved in cell wall biosynthesis